MGESTKRREERAFSRLARKCLEVHGKPDMVLSRAAVVARVAGLVLSYSEKGLVVSEAKESMRLVYAETAEGYWAGHNSKLLKRYLAELIQLMPLEALADV